MDSGEKQTTQKTEEKRDPYAPSVPALNTIVKGGLAAYNSGAGGGVYQGDRTAGLGSVSRAGLSDIVQNRNAGLGAAKAGDGFLKTTLANGGATAAGTAAVNGVLGVGGVDTSRIEAAADRVAGPGGASAVGGDLTGGKYNLDASGFDALNLGLAGPSQVERSLQDTADGKFLGAANPFTADMIAKAQGSATNAVKGQFAGSGRYGSGMFSAAVADVNNRAATDLLYKDYDAERGRIAQAAGAIDSATLARTGARQSLYGASNDVTAANAGQAVQGAQLGLAGDAAALQGAQSLASVEQANNQQKIGQYGIALDAANGNRSAAAGLLSAIPGVQSALQQPGKTLAGVGSVLDATRQQELAARQDVFNETENAPWRRLGLLSGVTLPVAGAGGTSNGTTVVTQPQPSMLQQLLGTALVGADVASKFIKPI